MGLPRGSMGWERPSSSAQKRDQRVSSEADDLNFLLTQEDLAVSSGSNLLRIKFRAKSPTDSKAIFSLIVCCFRKLSEFEQEFLVNYVARSIAPSLPPSLAFFFALPVFSTRRLYSQLKPNSSVPIRSKPVYTNGNFLV